MFGYLLNGLTKTLEDLSFMNGTYCIHIPQGFNRLLTYYMCEGIHFATQLYSCLLFLLVRRLKIDGELNFS